ncbi:MAG: HAMP domain-containing histidine kinase [Treponemataceae bacterium]|nr:HAMP domain-containing histidine kinase [Treponemataceae bacterium]
MSLFLLIAATLLFLAALGLVLYDRIKTKGILDSIENMLTQAMKGDFSESRYDESRLSKLESELSDYLSSSALSAKNVQNEKNKLKELISDISHQTKTPIANLVLFSELLEDSSLDGEARESVAAIRGQAEKLRFLIDSLVKLSRLESGIIALNRQRTELYPLLQNVTAQLKDRAAAKGLTLTLEPTEAVADIDPKWTQEAVFNIVDNAVKYTAQGSVAIKVIPYNMFVKVDVTDTGPGIAEEEQTKIFGRFYRSAALVSEDGVGIGLHLARQIVSGQGGYIKVSSPVGPEAASKRSSGASASFCDAVSHSSSSVNVDSDQGSGPGTTFSIYLPI